MRPKWQTTIPDILVHGWNKVRLSLTNHSAGGLTDVDFEHGAGGSTGSAEPRPASDARR